MAAVSPAHRIQPLHGSVGLSSLEHFSPFWTPGPPATPAILMILQPKRLSDSGNRRALLPLSGPPKSQNKGTVMPPSTYPANEVRAMRRFALFVVCFTAIVVLGVALPHSHHRVRAAAAQPSGNWHTGDCDDNRNHWGQPHVCQMRRTTFTLPGGRLSVNTTNGGIDVIGEDRSDVSLEARVTAWAPTESEANDLLS